jgi:cell division protein FtsW (lipid II flippase)
MVRRAFGRYAGAVVATFRGKLLLSLADRIWNLGQSLSILALTALIVLKLTGIAWSWWWVLVPLWIGGLVLPFLCLLVAGTWRDRRSRRLSGGYQDEEYGEPRSGGLTGGGWPWEVSLGRFRRSGTFRRR